MNKKNKSKSNKLQKSSDVTDRDESDFVGALKEGDPDKIQVKMLQIRKNMNFNDFTEKFSNFPSAIAMYKNYCKMCNLQNLCEIYVKEEDFKAQAELLIFHSLQERNSHLRDSFLSKAAEAYQESGNELYSTICHEELKLLTFQRQLNQEHFIGKTINETCFLLLKQDPNLAENFKNQYSIPDRRFNWLKIQSLAEMEKWDELEKLAKMEKCPLGFESFVDVCLQKNNPDEALKYLPKVREKLKVKYYIKFGYLERATKKAYKKRDILSLYLIRSKCDRTSTLFKKVNSYILKLE